MKHLRWYMPLGMVNDNEISKVVHAIVDGK